MGNSSTADYRKIPIKKNTIDVKQSATFVMSGVKFPARAVWYCNYEIA